MFKNLRSTETEKLNHSGRSLVGETLQLEGDLRSSGNVHVAGLINGNVEGKISADTVIIGRTAVIKGDIFFKNTLKTEEGADIDGYIKRVNNGKANTEEDIAIEEIVERKEIQKRKEKVVSVVHHKEAV